MPTLVVAHRGAAALAPENTTAAFDAALAAGAGAIELDVLPGDDGSLLCAHDPVAAMRTETIGITKALRHLAQPQFEHVQLFVDLKWFGYELEVIRWLEHFELRERSICCTQIPRSLVEVRRLDPGLKLSWSVPRVTRDPFRSLRTKVAAMAAIQILRRTLPARCAKAVREGRVDAITAQHLLVTAELVRQVHRAGGEIYAWTLTDAARAREIAALGVDGVIADDPTILGRDGSSRAS